jgi:hypothetical protein
LRLLTAHAEADIIKLFDDSHAVVS